MQIDADGAYSTTVSTLTVIVWLTLIFIMPMFAGIRVVENGAAPEISILVTWLAMCMSFLAIIFASMIAQVIFYFYPIEGNNQIVITLSQYNTKKIHDIVHSDSGYSEMISAIVCGANSAAMEYEPSDIDEAGA